MPRDLESLIRRVVAAGPDMRIPQGKDGYWNAALALFIGYFELGQHDVARGGVTVREDRVRLVFEVGAERPEPRNLGTRSFPYLVSTTTTLSLLPGARFFETFKRMNFEGAASHMVELLGEPFALYVRHHHSCDAPGPTITADNLGYVILPLKERDTRTGDAVVGNIAASQYRRYAFVWNCSDLDDWYRLYIPGEWPEERDAEGNITRPAKSKNFLQEWIMRAKNWPEHPLYAVAKLGPTGSGPLREPTQDERWRELKAGMQAVVAAYHREHGTIKEPRRKRRTTKRS